MVEEIKTASTSPTTYQSYNNGQFFFNEGKNCSFSDLNLDGLAPTKFQIFSHGPNDESNHIFKRIGKLYENEPQAAAEKPESRDTVYRRSVFRDYESSGSNVRSASQKAERTREAVSQTREKCLSHIK